MPRQIGEITNDLCSGLFFWALAFKRSRWTICFKEKVTAMHSSFYGKLTNLCSDLKYKKGRYRVVGRSYIRPSGHYSLQTCWALLGNRDKSLLVRPLYPASYGSQKNHPSTGYAIFRRSMVRFNLVFTHAWLYVHH